MGVRIGESFFFFSVLCTSPTSLRPSRSPLLPAPTLLRPTPRTSKTKLGLRHRCRRYSPLLRCRPPLRRRRDPEQKGSARIVRTSTRIHDFLTLTGTSYVRLADNSTLTHTHLASPLTVPPPHGGATDPLLPAHVHVDRRDSPKPPDGHNTILTLTPLALLTLEFFALHAWSSLLHPPSQCPTLPRAPHARVQPPKPIKPLPMSARSRFASCDTYSCHLMSFIQQYFR